MDLAVGLAYVGATLGVLMVVPQLVRILRNPGLGGVSPVTWSLTAIACTTWLTYGLRAGVWPQVPGNVLLVSGAVAIVLLVPSPVSRPRRAAYIAVAMGVLVGVACLLPPHAIGYLAFSVQLVSAWPQLYDSVQTWRAGERSSVSVLAWSMRVASQSCWLTYAVLAADVPVMISAMVSLSSALVLVALEASAQWAGRPELETA